jgi:hypothetical protein
MTIISLKNGIMIAHLPFDYTVEQTKGKKKKLQTAISYVHKHPKDGIPLQQSILFPESINSDSSPSAICTHFS